MNEVGGLKFSGSLPRVARFPGKYVKRKASSSPKQNIKRNGNAIGSREPLGVALLPYPLLRAAAATSHFQVDISSTSCLHRPVYYYTT